MEIKKWQKIKHDIKLAPAFGRDGSYLSFRGTVSQSPEFTTETLSDQINECQSTKWII